MAAVLSLALPIFVAQAGTQDGAVVTLHAAPHPLKGGDPCVVDPPDLPCSGFTTTWPLNTPCDLYLVVARGEAGAGVAALSCGVLYNHGEIGAGSNGEGVDVFSWTFCASGFPWPPYLWPGDPDDFPASGGGARITWDAAVDCQTTEIGDDGVHTLAGTFYVLAYSEDLFEIIPNRSIESSPDEFQVGDCSSNLTDLTYPDAAGAVAFGAGLGRNPCQAVPVRPLSWSRLKSMYGRSEHPR